MGLASQAIRLKRMNYGDRVDLLRDEIYLAFLTDRDPVIGPMTITFPDGTDPINLPEVATRGPNGEFVMPDLIFPDLLIPELQPQQEDTPHDPGPVSRHERVKSKTEHQRAVVPGVIVSGAGPTYSMVLAPNGSTGATMPIASALNLNHDEDNPLDAGDWALVFRHLELELKTTEYVETAVDGTETVISARVEVIVQQTDHEFTQSSGGGSSSAFPAVITGGGPGNAHTANVYLDGLGGDATPVDIWQLDIDAGETIPAGTAAIAIKVGETYYTQVPVWIGEEP